MSEFKGSKEFKLSKSLNNNDVYYITDQGGYVIATIENRINNSIKTEANAKLIACAPEMLEFINTYYMFLNIEDQKQAKQLIKKATQ